MMNVHYTHCGYHSTIYVSQIIHTLNIYSTVCQLYLKTREEKAK